MNENSLCYNTFRSNKIQLEKPTIDMKEFDLDKIKSIYDSDDSLPKRSKKK